MNKAQWKMVEELKTENKRLHTTLTAADQRLLDATDKIGAAPAGCDTADWLADEVLGLRKFVHEFLARVPQCTCAGYYNQYFPRTDPQCALHAYFDFTEDELVEIRKLVKDVQVENKTPELVNC